ncbi:class III lanthionine synthetase LanKC [Deinococcus aquaedulcis]|uniref:class III lanthionine synthetase LanKC n=1 Tax=Deinococcus aquaedulcis TaxID=2840455 RepID=UPI001C83BC34|nr:class III lanthionine synthetase LanKC [Deinococcus aquaedulcis]
MPAPQVDPQAQFTAILRRLHVHPEFYEAFERYQPAPHLLRVAQSFVPVTCRIIQEAFWTHVKPLGAHSPMQGWKIHVSATHTNAEQVLELAGRVCVAAGVPFKFASDYQILDMLLSKGCSRGSSGKFMTIYPNTVAQCQQLLDELYEALRGQEGPYILSDRRYKDSKVLYYRYGGILPVTRQDVSGEQASYLLSPELEEVPDERTPYFQLPAWVTDPFQPPEPDEDLILGEGRFQVTDVLSHSNTGGVYLARDAQTGQQVIIKEARPHVNRSAQGHDALDHLRKEYRLLTQLSGTGLAPEPVAFFTEWEHAFLVQERLKGKTLHTHALRRSKVIRSDASAREIAAWRREVQALAAGIVRLVAQLHRQGISFGDLSANNIMMLGWAQGRPRLKLIDFEAACEVGVDQPVNMFTPGYAPPSRSAQAGSSLSDDHFALGAVLMALLHPINALNGLKPTLYQDFGASLERDYALDPAYMAAIRTLTTPGAVPDLDDLARRLEPAQRGRSQPRPAILTEPQPLPSARLEHAAQDAIRYVLSVATPHRSDQLFPGGPQLSNPLTLDHGALGVALAVQAVSGEVPDWVREWISRQPLHGRYAPGYFSGLGGVTTALLRLNEPEAAARAFQVAGRGVHLFDQISLGLGACGYGLAALELHHATGEARYRQEAERIGEVLQATVSLQDDQATWPTFGTVRVGLAHGGSGAALFLLYLSRVTGRADFLDLGRQALNADLACGRRVDGKEALGFPDAVSGGILYPYLQSGSAGVGSVLLRYQNARPQPGDDDILRGIRAAVSQKYTLFPGLNMGLSGLGMYLLDVHAFQGDASALRDAHRAAEGTLLFGLPRQGGLAFPGDYLHRISADLGTGGAGVAVFLHRLAMGGASALFPDHLLAGPGGVRA